MLSLDMLDVACRDFMYVLDLVPYLLLIRHLGNKCSQRLGFAQFGNFLLVSPLTPPPPKVYKSPSTSALWGRNGSSGSSIFLGLKQVQYNQIRHASGFFSFLKWQFVGFKPLDKIQFSLSYLGNSWDKLTSQGIRNCKISFKLPKAMLQRPPWCQDPPLLILKPSSFTLSCSHHPSRIFLKAIQSNLQCKKGRVKLSEMRSGVKMGTPPGFICHTDKEILCFFKYFKDPEL